MIHGTLVKINIAKDGDDPVEKFIPETPQVTYLANPHLNFEPIKNASFPSFIKLSAAFIELAKKYEKNNPEHRLGFVIHNKKTIYQAKEITLIELSKNSASIKSCSMINPNWSLNKSPRRTINSGAYELEVNGAMQSQLFAMLDSSYGDDRFMQAFALKDHQQEDLYRWQTEYFSGENNMGADEMVSLMSNVLNVARLPWIKITFKEEGPACMFKMSSGDGGSLDLEHVSDKKGGDWDWLQNSDAAKFEKVGELKRHYRVRISDMQLVMIMQWAMRAEILLHELAHYITFIMPTKYRLNQGELKLSFREYEELFSGHGVIYISVFIRLLVDFMYIDEISLRESLTSAGIKYMPLKSLKLKDINQSIKNYLKT